MRFVQKRRALVLVVMGLLTLLAFAGPGMALPRLRGYDNARGVKTTKQVREILTAQRELEGTASNCGPGVCIGGSFCDDCVCYSPEAPISQVACRCRLMDPSCGVGECVGDSYCEGGHCPYPVCYIPSSPISQVMCGGARLDRDCKVVKGCGSGYCIGNSYCDDCVCYAPEAPISQVSCRCNLMDPACGMGECVGDSYCEGPNCPFPVCYIPTSTISQVMCQGVTLDPNCKVACTPPPVGMKAWWPFDETSGTQAFDIIGSNHGTHQNGPVPGAGKVASALFFDGTDDYVKAPAFSTHDYLNLTIDAWIRPDSTSTAGMTIVDFGDPIYRLILEGDELRFVTQPNPTSYFPLSNGANIPVGVWTHVAVVADASAQQIRYYVNGSLVTVYSSYVASYAYINPAWDWSIGGVPGQDYFDGAIDELEIFERPLATSEIQAIWSAGPGGKCK
jgi:hypothetical protein